MTAEQPRVRNWAIRVTVVFDMDATLPSGSAQTPQVIEAAALAYLRSRLDVAGVLNGFQVNLGVSE